MLHYGQNQNTPEHGDAWTQRSVRACVRACVRVCAHTNVHKHCVRVSLKLQVFDIQLGVWKITGGCWKPDGVVL